MLIHTSLDGTRRLVFLVELINLIVPWESDPFDCPDCRLLYALGSFAELEAAILILMQLSADSARNLAIGVQPPPLDGV
jgi:hypothetical protein